MSKLIVITGAGQGLGRALARRFAADGEAVVLLGRTFSKVQAAAEDIGERAFAVACDVASPDSVRRAFAAIAERHPHIDVLINNAAIYQPFPLSEGSDAQIQDCIAVNTMGPIFCARSAIAMMRNGSHIINVSSESVGTVFPFLTLYQTSKAGLERFSQALYHELKPSGIRVTCVRAGMMAEEGKTWDIDPEMGMRFARAAMEIGIKLGESPISHVRSVTTLFRMLVDSPPDLHVETASLHAWRAG